LERCDAIDDNSCVALELDNAAFPDDAADLRVLLAERDAVIAGRDAALAERDAALAERDAHLLNARCEIEKLKAQLAALRRERFGKSSERLAAEIGQLEMLIGDLEEDQAERDAAAGKARRTRGKSDAPRQPAVRRPLPEHLPRETILHEPVLACRCGCTDPARLTRLGEDVTEVLEKIPARLQVIRHVRPRYACRACEAVIQAPAPALPIERGRPGPGLMAHVLVSKYLDGLPLYRLSGILAREGVEIERQTLADWVGHGAWWLRPLAEAIGTYARAQGVIWTDDTPIRVLAPGRGRTRLGRFWVYAFDPRPWGGQESGHGPPAAFYCYSPTARASDHESTWPGMRAGCTRTPMPAMTRSPRRRAASRRASATSPAWRMRGASCSRSTSHQVADRRRGVAADRRALCHRGGDQRPVGRAALRGAPGAEQAAAGGAARVDAAAAAPAVGQVDARQGVAVCAQSLGCFDALYRGRQALD
jgi:transposase